MGTQSSRAPPVAEGRGRLAWALNADLEVDGSVKEELQVPFLLVAEGLIDRIESDTESLAGPLVRVVGRKTIKVHPAPASGFVDFEAVI